MFSNEQGKLAALTFTDVAGPNALSCMYDFKYLR